MSDDPNNIYINKNNSMKTGTSMNNNNSQIPLAAVTSSNYINQKDDEIRDFVEKLIKENCYLKREVISKEIDTEKLRELLKHSSIKYYNLDTGNANDTDKIYFNKIRNINLENDYKLNQINLKYENEISKLMNDHSKIINDIQNQNIKSTEKNELNSKIEDYLLKIKTLEEQLYNSEKFCQVLQQKYDLLFEENKMINNKINEEKENILFLISELSKENNSKKDELINIFQEKTNIITQNFISFSENEKAKANLVLENLVNEQKTLSDKIELLEEENNKLSEENNLLLEKNKSNEEFIAEKEVAVYSIDKLKENFTESLKKYEDEISNLTSTNLNFKKKISEQDAIIDSLKNKNELLQNSISDKIKQINNQNEKVIDDLTAQVLQLEQENREMSLKQNLKNNNDSKNKYAEILDKNEKLNIENDNLKYKIEEYESKINVLNEKYEQLNSNYEKMQKQYMNADQDNEEASKDLNLNKQKYLENEEEIKNLKENISSLESINDKLAKENNEIKQNNLKLNHCIDVMKLNYNIEITKYKNKINDYEKKLQNIENNLSGDDNNN